MSRIGNAPIKLPEGVKFEVSAANLVTVSSTKGTLTYQVPEVIKFDVKDGVVHVVRNNEEKHTRQLHGTVRANVYNMVVGVSEGFKKTLLMKGTGYKAEANAKVVTLYVGYSHPVKLDIPEGVKVTVDANQTGIEVSGINKQMVGQLAALIRDTRRPEPYLGKGVAYTNEHIRRKEGKKAGK